MKKAILIVVGAIVELLGLLWLVQGLGLVVIEPILCAANCETIRGPSTTWVVAGLIAIAIGTTLIFYALRGRKGAPPQ